MVTANHLQRPPPWPSSKGVSSPSPREHCLFRTSFRKEVTINHLLSHSVSSSSWRHHNDALWEGMWGMQFHPTKSKARPGPTYVLGRWTSMGQSKGAIPAGEPLFVNHINISEPVLMFKPMRGQDSRSSWIWDQILALMSCSSMTLASYITSLSLSSFLPSSVKWD